MSSLEKRTLKKLLNTTLKLDMENYPLDQFLLQQQYIINKKINERIEQICQIPEAKKELK